MPSEIQLTLEASSTRPAIEGGPCEISSTVSALPPQRWGDAEKELLSEMLDQPSLFYWNGPQTRLLVERFQKHYPLSHVMPCSSGTAAIHIAVAAAGIKPGDEVIVPPITDMGTVIGILYQQGVPVFADVDAHSYNLDPVSVREKITSKTRAIIAVHLAGNPCRIAELKSLADEFDLILIEDCAQAWGARLGGIPVGTVGHIGCYSLNDFKHIGCGDGGMVASSDSRFGPLLQKFGDKAYDRAKGTRTPEFLAPNYRISEPQSAVAAAQMECIDSIAEHRNALGSRLGEQIEKISGILPHKIDANACCSYWFYLFRIDEKVLNCDRARFAQALQAEGVLAQNGYIPMPLYRYDVFQNQSFFGGEWPVRQFGLTSMDYRQVSCPNAEAILSSCVFLRIHQGMDFEYIDGVARSIRKIAGFYAKA